MKTLIITILCSASIAVAANGENQLATRRGVNWIPAPPGSIVPMSPAEQARFEAWVKQWQPTPCVQDASLPPDTVRLQPGAENKIRTGYFFPTRPAKTPDYVPTGYVPTKVLRNDGKFLGWQYFAPAQLKYMHVKNRPQK